MDLRKYTKKALKTAQKEAFSYDYLIPGIVGEIGELFGQQAKAHWHGWPAEKLEDQLIKEYGDICWMTAILLHGLQVDDVMEVAPKSVADGQLQILIQASVLYHEYLEGEDAYLAGHAATLWNMLRYYAEPITGFPLDFALQANIEKLKSRKERGVLRGSGDNR